MYNYGLRRRIIIPNSYFMHKNKDFKRKWRHLGDILQLKRYFGTIFDEFCTLSSSCVLVLTLSFILKGRLGTTYVYSSGMGHTS